MYFYPQIQKEMTLQEFYAKGKIALAALYDEQESRAILKAIAAYYLPYTDAELLLMQNQQLKAGEVEQLEKCLEQVVKGFPVQYVLGETTFYGLDLYVDQGVLIPRQETEELVAWILEKETQAKQLLDIGVGSGNITVALGTHLKHAHFTAFDISLKALDLARENCDRYGLKPTFLYGDVLQWQKYGLDTYDVIVSNPPYVRELEKALMHENVLQHEPPEALFVSNENPLVFYEAIAELGQKHLSENGVLYFEINEYLGRETVQLLSAKGYKNIELRKDLNGKDRMIRAEKFT